METLVVLLVVLAFKLLCGLAFSPLLVNEVQSPGLDFTVDESAGETSQNLLGLLVAWGLTCIASQMSVQSITIIS